MTHQQNHTLPHLPQAEALLINYKDTKKQLGWVVSNEDETYLRLVFKIILQQGLIRANTYVDETGVGIPYTSFHLKEVAECVYFSLHKKLPKPNVQHVTSGSKREFIFGSIPQDILSGGRFDWCEFALQALLQHLQEALEAIKYGITMRDYEVFVFGYPTNEFGLVPSDLLLNLKNEGLRPLANVYAKMVQVLLPQNAPKKEKISTMTICLRGQSFGASIAAETAKVLLEGAHVTQDFGPYYAPRIETIMHSPAALLEMNPKLRKGPGSYLVYLEFLLEGLWNIPNRGLREMRRQMPLFLDVQRKFLKTRAFDSPMQIALKRKVIKKFWSMGRKGIPMPVGVKATLILGKKDLTISDKARKESFSPYVRKFLINSGHLYPFYTDWMWRIFDNLIAGHD